MFILYIYFLFKYLNLNITRTRIINLNYKKKFIHWLSYTWSANYITRTRITIPNCNNFCDGKYDNAGRQVQPKPAGDQLRDDSESTQNDDERRQPESVLIEIIDPHGVWKQ